MFVGAAPRSSELNLQGIRDRLRNIILDGENIGNLAVVPFRPEMRFIGDVNKLRGDLNAIARSADAPFENRSHPQLFTNGAQILFLAAKGKGRCASNYPQVRHLGEGIDNLFCQAVAEVLVFFIGAQVGERQHSTRQGLFASYTGAAVRLRARACLTCSMV